MLNHITIMGRLARDPEIRTTQSGKNCSTFTVAVARDFSSGKEKEADFLDCVAWGKTGEFVAKYFRKGSLIVVSGRLQIRQWTDKDVGKRKSAEIVAESCYFGESKRESGQDAHDSSYGMNFSAAAATTEYQQGNFAMLEDEDDQLPF